MAKKAQTTNSSYFNIVVTEKNRPYFGIYRPEPAEGLTEIKTFDKDGKEKGVKYYDTYSEIEGLIKSVLVYDKELDSGKKFEVLSVYVDAGNTTEVVSVSFESQFAQSFIKCIESVDVSKPVQLKVFIIKDEDKSASKGKEIFNDRFCIYQQDANGEWKTVKSKYKFIADPEDPKKNVNPNVLPEFKKEVKKKNGKEVTEWNTDDFNEALRQIVAAVNPEFKAAYEAAKKSPDAPKTQEQIDNSVNPNDDLPF